MDDNGSNGVFVVGFLLGALVGAAAALLLTPQSGKSTRILLQEKSSDIRTQVQNKLPTTSPPAGELEEEATEIAAE